MIQIVFYVMATVGCIVSICAAVAAVTMTVSAFIDWRHEPHQRSYEEGRRDQRNRLASDAWWFSESPETGELLRDLSSGMNVSDAREKWRKAREKVVA